MKSKFVVVIASRFMYDDYREYDRYCVNAKNKDNAINYAKKVVSYWNKNDISTTYEVFDVYEV